MINTLLVDYINQHDNNIITINKALDFTIIQLTQSLHDENPLNIDKHEVQ